MSRGFIQGLSPDQFLVGDVRQSVQAVDLAQLEFDLRSGEPVILEIFHTRWPPLKERMQRVFGGHLRMLSIFLTALPPEDLARMPRDLAESRIRAEVARILRWRGKDSSDEIVRRSETAVTEILEAVTKPQLYEQVFLSAPEGPDGEDDWTSDSRPLGQAAEAFKSFLAFLGGLDRTGPKDEVICNL